MGDVMPKKSVAAHKKLPVSHKPAKARGEKKAMSDYNDPRTKPEDETEPTPPASEEDTAEAPASAPMEIPPGLSPNQKIQYAMAQGQQPSPSTAEAPVSEE